MASPIPPLNGPLWASAPASIIHDHEDQILLARHLVRKANTILISLNTVSQLIQHKMVSVANLLRTVRGLRPEVYHEAFLQSFRSQCGRKQLLRIQ
ncbi:hypothetical protein OOT00_03775 [Desulfobotulus sp. H1]|uniref:Uncharacterized protein n=1 Tax=Desulfobotulus pelophilus TaxID=2823377 RepID=A0ABT3N6L9_9BACT|nr:hypothetical protein [Desulfobotulus pelophilus]MCW7753103.1 hypothetical protein [Desulfobotulus pelophilus]